MIRRPRHVNTTTTEQVDFIEKFKRADKAFRLVDHHDRYQ